MFESKAGTYPTGETPLYGRLLALPSNLVQAGKF